jgi:hypothetical protein
MGTGGRGSRLQPSLLNPDEASILLASQEPQALHKTQRALRASRGRPAAGDVFGLGGLGLFALYQ